MAPTDYNGPTAELSILVQRLSPDGSGGAQNLQPGGLDSTHCPALTRTVFLATSVSPSVKCEDIAALTSRAAFLNTGTINTLGQKILVKGAVACIEEC